MIHHVSIEASDLERSEAFYDATLAALGWRRHANLLDPDGHRVEVAVSPQ